MTWRWLGLGLMATGLATAGSAAQRAVPIEREPRHRVVIEVR